MKKTMVVCLSFVIGAGLAWTDTGNQPCPPESSFCPCGTNTLVSATPWCCKMSLNGCAQWTLKKFNCNTGSGCAASTGYYTSASGNPDSPSCDPGNVPYCHP